MTKQLRESGMASGDRLPIGGLAIRFLIWATRNTRKTGVASTRRPNPPEPSFGGTNVRNVPLNLAHH